MDTKIRIGYVPTRRSNFSVEEALKYKKIIRERIGAFDAEVVDIEDINSEGLLLHEEDVPKVIRKLQDARVDAIFIAHCNFGCEGAVTQVARALNVPVLLYGPRDDAPDATGMRTRDSQCGLFACGKVLRRNNVKFTYITNVSPDDRVFIEGYEKFLRVVCVVKTMKNIRVLQLGPRPNDFQSVMANESELLEKFNVRVFTASLLDLKHAMEDIAKNSSIELEALCEWIRHKYKGAGVEDEVSLKTLASMKLAIRALAARYNCNCACIQCWTAMQREMNIYPCAVNSMLADEGFPVACETDICGAISAMLIQAATGNKLPHFLADLTVRHPENENIELLWHCGAFCSTFARDPGDCKITRAWDGNPECGNCAWELRNGDITVCRFDGDHGEYSLFLGEGRGVDGPLCRGTYVWFEVDDWAKWEHHLVQGPYIHHIAGTYGKVADVLQEACKYIPGLKPDPVSPSEAELYDRYIH